MYLGKYITMATNTKKILILGNGFDLDLGRKTSYANFYNSEHCPKDYPAPIIKHLNEKWTDNLEAVKWYDLENEILNYYEKIKALGGNYDLYNANERKIILQIKQLPTHTSYPIIKDNIDVVNRLLTDNILSLSSNNHLIVHPDAFLSPVERDKKAVKLIKEGLIEYLKGIERAETNYNSVAMMVVRTFLYNYRDIADYIVYSFNYMDLFHKDEKMVTKLFNSITKFVHGSIKNNDIIIGTKDYEISPAYDFIQKSFDMQFNPPAIVDDLSEADDVTFFGHSLGVNDSQYLKSFFMEQASITAKRKNITFFTRDNESELQLKRELQKMTNWNFSQLCTKNNIQFIKTIDSAECNEQIRIYVNRFCSDGYDIQRIIYGENYTYMLNMRIDNLKYNRSVSISENWGF